MEIAEPWGGLMRWHLSLWIFDSDVFHKKGTFNTQEEALYSLGTTVEAKSVEDIEIPCFVGESDERNTEDWSKDICDDIIASYASKHSR